MKQISRKPLDTQPASERPICKQPVNGKSITRKQTNFKQMKRIQWIGIFIFVLFLAVGEGSFLQAQTKQESTEPTKQEKREQKEKEVREWIANGDFTVSVDRALPMGGRSIPLTTLYSITLKNDSVFSYLPYFGRAYTAPYGGGNSMDFTKQVTDYDCTYTSKGAAVIQFKAKTNDDHFTFRLQIYPNGSTTIQVTPVNRQSITYYGEIVPQKERMRKTDAVQEKEDGRP